MDFDKNLNVLDFSLVVAIKRNGDFSRILCSDGSFFDFLWDDVVSCKGSFIDDNFFDFDDLTSGALIGSEISLFYNGIDDKKILINKNHVVVCLKSSIIVDNKNILSVFCDFGRVFGTYQEFFVSNKDDASIYKFLNSEMFNREYMSPIKNTSKDYKLLDINSKKLSCVTYNLLSFFAVNKNLSNYDSKVYFSKEGVKFKVITFAEGTWSMYVLA